MTLDSSGSGAACRHCGQAVPAGRGDGFCCAGCLAVNRLLAEEGLGAYYHLRPPKIQPLLGYFDKKPDLSWLQGAPGLAEGRLELCVEGVQCGACVWAIERLAQKKGGARVGVNTVLGRLSLRFDPKIFDAKSYLEALASFGYRARLLGSEEAVKSDASRDLLLRLGVCAAVAMNSMSFSLPIYLGLQKDHSGLYELLRQLNVGLTLIAVSYGGSYFFSRAWRALRQGIAHFDIPIAMGVAAAFLGSLWAWQRGETTAIYFDSVNVFLTFMLAGRFLQERALTQNQRKLLKSEAFGSSRVTRLDEQGLATEIRFSQVRQGQRLLLQPGSLCPAEAVLQGQHELEFDLAAVTGEAKPHQLGPGASLPAGARLLSSSPALLIIQSDFSASLLGRIQSASQGDEDLPIVWRWAVRWYVLAVLGAAASGLILWWHIDRAKAAQVFISTLVVTCPCGLGIAVPLARALADRRLAGAGLIVRRPGLLERLRATQRVFLDKTGTLTLSQLQLSNPDELSQLEAGDRVALMGAAASSRHPVSQAIYRELAARGQAYPLGGQAIEIAGQGVRYRSEQGEWWLGRDQEAQGSRAVFERVGKGVLSRFEMEERLLDDAASAVADLASKGVETRLLSGDSAIRVEGLARVLGIAPEAALSAQSPQDKVAAVSEKPSLMLGDGLNDAGALNAATVSGAPAWERSPQADQADFQFAAPSLAWLPELYRVSRRLRAVVWGNLVFAGVYNLALVTVTLSGLFSPLLCAISMPGSAVLAILGTRWAMARGRS